MAAITALHEEMYGDAAPAPKLARTIRMLIKGGLKERVQDRMPRKSPSVKEAVSVWQEPERVISDDALRVRLEELIAARSLSPHALADAAPSLCRKDVFSFYYGNSAPDYRRAHFLAELSHAIEAIEMRDAG